MRQPLHLDSTQTPSVRAASLLEKLSLRDKVGQMCQMDGSREPAERWVTDFAAGSILHVTGERAIELQKLAEVTGHGIPLLFGIDAIHGHGFQEGATVFPTQLSLSSSWNPELVGEVGRITAREVAATGLHWTFSPVLCNGRDPRWGRMSETFGEDPHLIEQLAVAMIQGYQGTSETIDEDHILACAKHYVAYGESLGGRDSCESEVSRRKLRSLFLPPFEAAAKAGCATFMAGYQSIDGTPVSADPWLLREVLCEEWGFRGFVVTDWDNVGSFLYIQKICDSIDEAAEIAVRAGNHLIMNTPDFFQAAMAGVEAGRIPLQWIDDAVRRILEQKFALGLFDQRRYPKPEKLAILGSPDHRQAARQAARESVVLLENRHDTLPLAPKAGRIALIGPNADDHVAQLADWSFGPNRPELIENRVRPLLHEKTTITLRDALQARSAKGDFELTYHRGCHPWKADEAAIEEAVSLAAEADTIVLCLGDHPHLSGERRDRANLHLSGAQDALFTALRALNKPLIVVLITSKPLCIEGLATSTDALLLAGNPGSEGGHAIAEVLFGDYDPHGKLTVSWPRHEGQLPVYYNQLPGWHGDRYVDCEPTPLYPFGFGRNYTHIECVDLKVASESAPLDGAFELEVSVRNSGPRAGHEVIQLYVRDEVSSVLTPVKTLKDFAHVQLEAGSSTEVHFRLPVDRLWLIDREGQKVVEKGKFTLMAGTSSAREDLLSATVQVC